MSKREVVMLSVNGGRGRETSSRNVGKAILQNLTDLDIHTFAHQNDDEMLYTSADEVAEQSTLDLEMKSISKRDKFRDKEKAGII